MPPENPPLALSFEQWCRQHSPINIYLTYRGMMRITWTDRKRKRSAEAATIEKAWEHIQRSEAP